MVRIHHGSEVGLVRNKVRVLAVVAALAAACAVGFFLGRWFDFSARSSVLEAADSLSVSSSEAASFSTVVAEGDPYTVDERQNIAVYRSANEAVVNITTEMVGVNWFLEPVPLEGGSGSGAIIDARGYVLTNTHVIEGASKIYLSLHDGSQYKATVVGVDRENDLAVLKFVSPPGARLTVIRFGSSRNLDVGQKVLAIGNPFGLARTLTVGVVSALARPIQNKGSIIRNMIQTDAAINPGNSGGPLLDTQGRMIGINTVIYSTSGSSSGVGFAVPVDTAKRIVSELIRYGRVRRGKIDAELVQVNASIAHYAQLTVGKGLLVSQVKRGSPAAQAGLRGGTTAVRYGLGRRAAVIYLGGDVITAIDNQPVANLSDYYSVLEDKKPDDEVRVTVLRCRRQHVVAVRLTERSDE